MNVVVRLHVCSLRVFNTCTPCRCACMFLFKKVVIFVSSLFNFRPRIFVGVANEPCCCSSSIFLNINFYLKSNLVISTNLSDKDILFGIIGCEDEIFVNHILLLAKQYVYSCRQNKYSPFIRVLNSKLRQLFS